MIKAYIRGLWEVYKTGGREESYYTVLKEFLETKGVKVLILPKKTEAGFPDLKVFQPNGYIVGYIESKRPQENLEKFLNTEQIERYKNHFGNFILTNFLEFIHFVNGKEINRVKLLEFKDFEKGNFSRVNSEDLKNLLRDFLNYQEKPIKSPQELAKALSWRVRLLKEEIFKELKENENLKKLYDLIKRHIIHNISEEEFADTIAQALSYALLILRVREEFIRKEDVISQIPESLSIIRDIFIEILKIEGKELEWIIDEIENTLNLFDTQKAKLTPEELTIHFYEPFLKEYNPQLREVRGVYYTPKAVVRFIVRSVEEVLKNRFGFEDGFAQEGLKLLDPAGGTLTFILEVLYTVKKHVENTYGGGFLKEFFERNVLNNFFAFELLPAPYVIGHLKVGKFLSEIGITDKKFKFFLTNALEFSHDRIPYLFSHQWAKEIKEADRIKRKEKILVILGNPPYSGISANNQREINEFLKKDVDGCQSYYKVDGRDLGEKNPKWLLDDYVKFIRFAQWKIQQGGKGVVGYITNHAYIDNPTFKGMRQSLLKTFDRIYILDLHGNKRKKEPDENVFDIQQGVAIGIFVKDGSKKGEYAEVYYYSTLKDKGILKRLEKFEFLENNTIGSINWHKVNPKSPFYFFKPVEQNDEYQNFLGVDEIFNKFSVGIVTGRDKLVIDFTEKELIEKISRIFQLTRKQITPYVKRILYRPFDVRFIFYNPKYLERPREEIMSHILAGENLGLITHKREEINVEWKHLFVTRYLTEHGALSSKTTNYLFPLYLYNHSRKIPNFRSEFRNYLKRLYGKEPSPEEVFYYIYAVLYSPTYRKKYGEQLRYNFPRIPFVEDYEKFKELSKVGEKLVKLHLLEDESLKKPSVRFEGKGNNLIERISYRNQKVFINKNQYFTPVGEDVWSYKIGGYQVLKKWLSSRKGRKLSLEELKIFLKVVKAIEETIELQKELENLSFF